MKKTIWDKIGFAVGYFIGFMIYTLPTTIRIKLNRRRLICQYNLKN